MCFTGVKMLQLLGDFPSPYPRFSPEPAGVLSPRLPIFDLPSKIYQIQHCSIAGLCIRCALA